MADVTNTYYASEGFIGYGAQLFVGQGDGSPETFVAAPVISTITPGDMTTGVVDATHLRSPARHREKKGTIRDSGPITFAGQYIPQHGAHKQAGGDGFNADHSLIKLWQNVTENNFQIVMPDRVDFGSPGSPITGLSIDVRGIVSRYQIGEIGLDSIVPFTLEITPLQDYSTGLP